MATHLESAAQNAPFV